jgi:hypothetical protein
MRNKTGIQAGRAVPDADAEGFVIRVQTKIPVYGRVAEGQGGFLQAYAAALPFRAEIVARISAKSS